MHIEKWPVAAGQGWVCRALNVCKRDGGHCWLLRVFQDMPVLLAVAVYGHKSPFLDRREEATT